MKRSRNGKVNSSAGRPNQAAAAPRPPAPVSLRPQLTPLASRSRIPWLAVLAIVLAALVIYIPALRCGFIWDDDDYVTQNMTLRSLGGLAQIWFKLGATPQYYPLVFTTFWTEFHLWGLSPFGYHLVNVLLHAGSALLLWTVLRRLRVRGAWLAGLLFAVHPVAVESVAWITERKNVLSTFLYLLSFLAMIRFYGIDYDYDYDYELRAREKSSWGFYGLALFLFFAALLSKTVTCTLPGALVIAIWWKRGKLKLRELLPLLPLFALGAAMGLLTAWMEKHFVRAQGVDFTLFPLDRILLAGRIIWFYLAKLALPLNLTFIYPRWTFSSGAGWQYLFPLGVVAAALALWLLRRRIGRGPLAALAFFVASLFPALGFIDVYPMRYSFVADHFQYLAMLGPLALAGALITLALDRLRPERRPLGLAAVAALAILLGALTLSLGPGYKDPQTLWTNNLARNPGSTIALNNLGLILIAQGDRQNGQKMIERALELNPRFAESHINLANLKAEEGLAPEALDHYARAAQLDPHDARPPFNIGNIMIAMGKLDEAIAAFNKALELNADLPDAHFNLATALADRRRFAEALPHFQRAHALTPGDPAATERLAWLLAAAPDARLRNGAAAVALAEEACRAAGDNPQCADTLAIAYAEAGRFEAAAAAAQKAIALARAAHNEPLAQAAGAHSARFQARQPYHEDGSLAN